MQGAPDSLKQKPVLLFSQITMCFKPKQWHTGFKAQIMSDAFVSRRLRHVYKKLIIHPNEKYALTFNRATL